jgi:hypothetical protein
LRAKTNTFFFVLGSTSVAAILAGRSVIAVEKDPVQVNIICQRLTELSMDLTNPDINQWNVDRSGPKESEDTWTIIRRGHLRTVKARGVRLRPVRELYNIEYKPTIEQVKSADLHQQNLKEGVAKEGRKADAEIKKKNKDTTKMAKVGVHTKAPPPTPVIVTLKPTGVESSSSSSSSSQVPQPVEDDDESSVLADESEEETSAQFGMMDGHVTLETMASDIADAADTEAAVDALFNAETSTSDAVASASTAAVVPTAAAAAASSSPAADAVDAVDSTSVEPTLLIAKAGVHMPSPATAAKGRTSTRVLKGDKAVLFDEKDALADDEDAKDSTPLAKTTRHGRQKAASKSKKQGTAAAEKPKPDEPEAYVHQEEE